MIREKMYKQIQTYKRQWYCKKDIASILGMDPKTVIKYYCIAERDFKTYRQEHMFRDKLMSE